MQSDVFTDGYSGQKRKRTRVRKGEKERERERERLELIYYLTAIKLEL